jgi:hypothetical protein
LGAGTQSTHTHIFNTHAYARLGFVKGEVDTLTSKLDKSESLSWKREGELRQVRTHAHTHARAHTHTNTLVCTLVQVDEKEQERAEALHTYTGLAKQLRLPKEAIERIARAEPRTRTRVKLDVRNRTGKKRCRNAEAIKTCFEPFIVALAKVGSRTTAANPNSREPNPNHDPNPNPTPPPPHDQVPQFNGCTDVAAVLQLVQELAARKASKLRRVALEVPPPTPALPLPRPPPPHHTHSHTPHAGSVHATQTGRPLQEATETRVEPGGC